MTKNYNTCICTHSHMSKTIGCKMHRDSIHFDAMRCDSADDVGRVMKPPSFQSTPPPLHHLIDKMLDWIYSIQTPNGNCWAAVLRSLSATNHFFVYKFIIIFSVEYLLQLLLYFSFANIKAKFLFQYAYLYIHTYTHTYKYVYMFVSIGVDMQLSNGLFDSLSVISAYMSVSTRRKKNRKWNICTGKPWLTLCLPSTISSEGLQHIEILLWNFTKYIHSWSS